MFFEFLLKRAATAPVPKRAATAFASRYAP
jgi:hypothetical protein